MVACLRVYFNVVKLLKDLLLFFFSSCLYRVLHLQEFICVFNILLISLTSWNLSIGTEFHLHCYGWHIFSCCGLHCVIETAFYIRKIRKSTNLHEYGIVPTICLWLVKGATTWLKTRLIPSKTPFIYIYCKNIS